tara:strand:- start:220 stop:447 length:228 start_codon:yes stop_codon:yes gene_type:complete
MNSKVFKKWYEENQNHPIQIRSAYLALIAYEDRDRLIVDAVKNCFPNPCCTEGFQLVPDDHYNNLVKVLNSTGDQ